MKEPDLKPWQIRARVGGNAAVRRIFTRITRRKNKDLMRTDDSLVLSQPKKMKDFWWRWL